MPGTCPHTEHVTTLVPSEPGQGRGAEVQEAININAKWKGALHQWKNATEN